MNPLSEHSGDNDFPAGRKTPASRFRISLPCANEPGRSIGRPNVSHGIRAHRSLPRAAPRRSSSQLSRFSCAGLITRDRPRIAENSSYARRRSDKQRFRICDTIIVLLLARESPRCFARVSTSPKCHVENLSNYIYVTRDVAYTISSLSFSLLLPSPLSLSSSTCPSPSTPLSSFASLSLSPSLFFSVSVSLGEIRDSSPTILRQQFSNLEHARERVSARANSHREKNAFISIVTRTPRLRKQPVNEEAILISRDYY